MNTHVDMKILIFMYILIYTSFVNSYFLSSISKWSLPLRESWRRILQNASSHCIKSSYQVFALSLCIKSLYQVLASNLCIKSLHQVIISTYLTKQLHQVIHIKSWYQVFVSGFSYQVFISILCIKSLHHIQMSGLFVESLY